MKINALYGNARQGDEAAEKELFQYLTARFNYLAQLDIGNEADAEEIAQEALMTVVQKYREIDIHTSFSSWAYKVLENKVLDTCCLPWHPLSPPSQKEDNQNCNACRDTICNGSPETLHCLICNRVTYQAVRGSNRLVIETGISYTIA